MDFKSEKGESGRSVTQKRGFLRKNRTFLHGHFVTWPCVFINIVGSTFIFNIFFISHFEPNAFAFINLRVKQRGAVVFRNRDNPINYH